MKKRIISLLLVLVMIVGLTACGGKETGKKGEENTSKQAASENKEGEKEPAQEEEATYTYNEAWSSQPLNWNPHSWQMSNEDAFMQYTTAPFVYATFDDGDGWKYEYDAATGVKDITAEFADKEKYGVPADATEQYVYEIKLRPEMKWENGEPIKADDYIESAKLLLDPSMKNYRANTFINGDSAVANAELYYNNDKAGKPIYAAVVQDGKDVSEGKDMFLVLRDAVTFFGGPAKEYYENEKYKEFFVVEGTDLFEKYKEDYVPFTDEMKKELNAVSAAFGDTNPEAYKEWLVYDTGEKYPETSWDKVGFVKVDDYTILYILQNPLQSFYMHSSLTNSWLVHKPTYEKNMKTVENLKATDYGTSLETTICSGPYKVESFEKDKQIVLVRNENYWAYKDGKFNPDNGMYRADKVVIDIVEDPATQEQLFMQGNIDGLGLDADKMVQFRKSDRLTLKDETYTARYIFATDLETLKSRDAEKGSGARVMFHLKDFRKAISRSIDRAEYCQEATPGFKPAFFLFNSLYYYDMANDPTSVYRDSSYAKKAVLDAYDVKYTDETVDAEYKKITGRDLEEAKELYKKAYDEAIKMGIYKDGQDVPLEIMVTPAEITPQHQKQQELMQKYVNEGSKGTPFEGKIKVTFESGDKNRYANVALGKNMAIHGAWGGAAFYPFSTVRVYTNPGYMGGLEKIHESNGWNPSTEELEMTIERADGTTVTESRTFEDWSNQINGLGEYASDAKEQLQVFSQLESGILQAYQCIPLGTYTAASLVSYKVDNAKEDYHIMYDFGGFRYLIFNYNDAEWKAFVEENGGELNYE